MTPCIIPGIRARERGPSRLPREHLSTGSCAGLRLGPGAIRMLDRTAPDPHALDVSPICGALHAWPPLTVQIVSQSPREPLWDQLGARTIITSGIRSCSAIASSTLRFLQDRPVAALSFSAPARVLRVRDRWIGWSAAHGTPIWTG